MGGSEPPIPSGDDLIALFQAAVANARDLLAEAQSLLEAGHIPRAHALATFAAEELGKGYLCVMALVVPENPSVQPKAFWEEFYSHPKKLRRVLGVRGLLLSESVGSVQKVVGSLPGESRAVHKRKVLGLFVDYEDGVIRLPAEISANEARQVIDDVQKSLNVVARAFAPEDALDLLRHVSGSGRADFLGQMLQVLGPERDALGSDPASLFEELLRQTATDPSTAVTAWRGLWSEFRV